uniref:Mediator of RNA polymerase II transcription subunit 14 n=2 Tax=Amphimedon queenslandica TaxID=400682 RepID=A0A1X7SZN9_AMPQE
MPILSLAPAIDVLTTGSYPRLPTCIKNRIIPRPPLTPEERAMTFILIEGVIRYRLAREHLPSAIMKVKSIGNGRVILTVPYEFEVTLTLVGDDLSLPWRVLDLKILVGHALSGSPVLVTEQQRLYLLQLVQSRLCSVDGNLNDMFNTLHHFCLSLQLDCLHAEVERLSVAVCGVYMKVEDYVPGHLIRLVYWRHTGPAYLLNNTSCNCQLHLFQLTCLSSSVGLSHSFSLPLLSPLPEVPSPVFIKLDHVTYLLVSVSIEGGVAVGGVTESYYMLRVFPSPYLPLVSDEQIPRSFFKIESLIRISTSSAFDHMTGIISMSQGTSKLKRKLLDSSLLVPSAKRLCLYPEVPLPPLSGLLATQNMITFLQATVKNNINILMSLCCV